VQAQPFISVFHLYKQSSSDNRVVFQMAHAAIFQSQRLNSRPYAHFLYNSAFQLCSTIVATTKIALARPAKKLRLHGRRENFLNSWATITSTRRTLVQQLANAAQYHDTSGQSWLLRHVRDGARWRHCVKV
jgi:nitric oxide reductase activation protein